jgi:hypothetical protein
MSQVNTELGRSSTATISLNESAVRTLAGVSAASGTTISMDNLRGKSAMSVSANSVSGFGQDFAFSGPVNTGTPSTTVTGGTAPYTYLWTQVSGSFVPQISNSTAQNPFWFNNDTPEGFHEAVWRVTVTATGGATATRDIIVTLQWTSLF